MHRQLAVLPLRVGTIAGHTLPTAEKDLPAQLWPAQTLVHIRVKTYFLISIENIDNCFWGKKVELKIL